MELGTMFIALIGLAGLILVFDGIHLFLKVIALAEDEQERF